MKVDNALTLINVSTMNSARKCVPIPKEVITAAALGATPSNWIVGLARSLKLLDVYRIQLQSHVHGD